MAEVQTDEPFETLLDYIKRNRGFDFSGYKRPTLRRRVERRMQALGVTTYEDYRERLEVQPDEFAELFDTILINVTSFFRDEQPWEYLAQEIIPELVGGKAETETIRVWSTG